MFKQFQKTEKKYIFKVKDRVRYIGQIMNIHPPNARETLGTILGIYSDDRVFVVWDDDTDSEESVDDLELVRIDSVSAIVSEVPALPSTRHKVDHQRDSSVHNVQELRNRVDKIRKGWFSGESKRNNKGYSPSEHDKIKFNINLYLGQCLEFFTEDPAEATAIVLDSEDLGSSATLAAFGVQPKHIYVPNYFEKNTEYTTMKANLPELASFPVSLEGFLTALEDSQDTADFHKKLRSEWKSTRYNTRRPALVEPLPTRFEHLDFAYLDYCGMFMNSARPNNADTVDAMFAKHVFPEDSAFILAITGSLHAISIKDLNKELNRYKSAVIGSATENGYRLKEDQFFVYNRSHQEGGVEESLAHRKENFDEIPEDVHFKKQSHSSKMFFMSFIGNGKQETLDEWDELFDPTCPDGLCKVQFGRRECLYQRGFINKDRVVLTKPFCNYRITNLYFWDTSFSNYAATIEKFAGVPVFEEEEEEDDEEDQKTDAEFLEEFNRIKKYRKLPEGILTTFKVIKSTKRKMGTIEEIIDMTKVIEQVRVARNERGEGYQIEHEGYTITLDGVYEIETDIVSGKVSIECILGDIVGIHFTESDHIDIPGVENILSSAFLIQIDDFCGMLVHAKKGAVDSKGMSLKVGDSVNYIGDDDDYLDSDDESHEDKEGVITAIKDGGIIMGIWHANPALGETEFDPEEIEKDNGYRQPVKNDRIRYKSNEGKYYEGEIVRISPKGRSYKINWDDGKSSLLKGSIFREKENYGKLWRFADK